VIIHILGQIVLFKILLVGSTILNNLVIGNCLGGIEMLVVYQLTHVQNGMNYLEIYVFFVNYGCQKIFDEFAQSL